MTAKERLDYILSALEKEYPMADCTLEERDPWKLLVQVRLAAQCTDARVNMVTPALFERYPNCEAMAQAEAEEIEPFIHSCGFFRAKARDIVGAAKMLLEVYDGRIPDTVEEMCKLPGVGRKTANLVCGDIYGVPGVVVADTHCIRISGRLGLTDSKDPYKVELALRKLLDPAESSDFCHRIVLFGRDVCSARSPRCFECPLADVCKKRL